MPHSRWNCARGLVAAMLVWVLLAGVAAAEELSPAATEALRQAEGLLATAGDRFGLAEMRGQLTLQDAFRSPGASHVRYRQHIDEVEVVGAYLYLHFTHGGRLFQADSTLSMLQPAGTWVAPEAMALAAVRRDTKASGRLPSHADQITPVWFDDASGVLIPVWQVETSSRSPLADTLGYVDARDGGLIDARNRLCTATGSGLVFDPSPVVALQDPTLTDMGDSCYAQMMAARTSVPLERLDGSGRLTGTWVSTASSSVARALEPSLVFNYCRDTSLFSEVMVYYHIDTTQAWIQSLGFTNVNNRQQVTNPYANCGAPNAYYSPGTTEITFCRDGIDSSEDADVILHEYGHSIHDNQVPGWGNCQEGRAMGEGFGDYLAESAFSLGPGSFQYGDLGDWFGVQTGGTGSGTGLRTVLSSKVYPRDYVGQVHADGEIWVAALWQIWESLGRSTTDTLVLESHFLLTPGADFMDGGAALMQADQVLNGGVNQPIIQDALMRRGLYFPQDGLEPNDVEAQAQPLSCDGNSNLVVESGETDWYTFEVRGGGGWLTFYHHSPSPSGATTCVIPYDFDVYDPGGTPVASQGTGGTNRRVVLLGASPGTYKVRVRGNSGARFAYDLDYVEVNDGSAVFSGMCGDCDSDGSLTILDALACARVGVGLLAPTQPESCDVDSSGQITILDGLATARWVSGLPVTLSCVPSICGLGNARDLACGGMTADSIAVSTDPLGAALHVPGATHYYRLTQIPPGTTSILIGMTGTGDLDILVARPGSLPGSTGLNRYPTSGDMRSSGPDSTENVTLNGGTIYSPADFAGGPLTFAVTAFTAGSYTLTITCN